MNNDPKEQAAQDKTPMQLLPPDFMEYTAMALEDGANKYGPFNWREGEPIKLMTYLGAILRHTCCLLSGQWWDKESKLPHAAHIAATCAILIDARMYDQLDDDTTSTPAKEPTPDNTEPPEPLTQEEFDALPDKVEGVFCKAEGRIMGGCWLITGNGGHSHLMLYNPGPEVGDKSSLKSTCHTFWEWLRNWRKERIDQ